jgi:hypothetical protein
MMALSRKLVAASALLCAMLLVTNAASAQPAGSAATGTTRLLVTEYHVRSDRVEEWLAIQRSEIVPTLRKAGVEHYTVYETVIGDASEFFTVRLLPSFAEFDGLDPLEQVLGVEGARYLEGKLHSLADSIHRRIEHRQNDLLVDPGDARGLVSTVYKPLPGRGEDALRFIRSEVLPAVRQAKQNGELAGFAVTVAAEGGRPGVITLQTYYPLLAPLDRPPAAARTLAVAGSGEAATRAAELLEPLEQTVLRRVPELSF